MPTSCQICDLSTPPCASLPTQHASRAQVAHAVPRARRSRRALSIRTVRSSLLESSEVLRGSGSFASERQVVNRRRVHVRCATQELAASSSEPEALPKKREVALKILVFIIPATASMLLGPVLSMIDTVFVGKESVLQLAALGPATTVSDITQYLFSWLGVATITFLARATSLKDEDAVARYTRTALTLAIICGTGVMVWHATCAGGLLKFLGATPEMLAPAATYVKIRALGFPVGLLNTAMWGICMGNKDSTTPLLVALMNCLVNAGLDYYMCAILGLGIGGAAFATVAAQYACCIIYPLSMIVCKRNYLQGLFSALPRMDDVKEFLQFALPVMFVTGATLSVYAVMGWLAAAQSLAVAAAHKVAAGIFQFFAFSGEPMFQVAQALMPHGQPKHIKQFKTILPIMAGCNGYIIGGIAVASTLGFPNLFTSDLAVVNEVAMVMLPFFFSLVLIIPSRAMQGLVVAQQDLTFYAGLTAVNAVLFACAVNFFAMSSAVPYLTMWWIHVGFYAVNNVQYLARLFRPADS